MDAADLAGIAEGRQVAVAMARYHYGRSNKVKHCSGTWPLTQPALRTLPPRRGRAGPRPVASPVQALRGGAACAGGQREGPGLLDQDAGHRVWWVVWAAAGSWASPRPAFPHCSRASRLPVRLPACPLACCLPLPRTGRQLPPHCLVGHVYTTRLPACMPAFAGGMNDVMYRMHRQLGEPWMLTMAMLFDKPSFYQPLVAGEDRLANIHANTHLAQVSPARCGWGGAGSGRRRHAARAGAAALGSGRSGPGLQRCLHPARHQSPPALRRGKHAPALSAKHHASQANRLTTSTSGSSPASSPPQAPPTRPPAQVNGFIARYEATNDSDAQAAVTNFFNILVNNHSYATGGSNDNEFWQGPNHLGTTLVVVSSARARAAAAGQQQGCWASPPGRQAGRETAQPQAKLQPEAPSRPAAQPPSRPATHCPAAAAPLTARLLPMPPAAPSPAHSPPAGHLAAPAPARRSRPPLPAAMQPKDAAETEETCTQYK
jgi:hypothetical protein